MPDEETTEGGVKKHKSGPFSIIPTRAATDPDIGSAAYRLLGLMASYADADNICWPSQSTLATRMQLSERAIRQQLASLEEAGYVTGERRFHANGAETSKAYRLHFDDIKPVGGVRVRRTRGARETHRGGARETHQTDPDLNRSNEQVADRLLEAYQMLSGTDVPSAADERQLASWASQGVAVDSIDAALTETLTWHPKEPWAAFRKALGRIHVMASAYKPLYTVPSITPEQVAEMAAEANRE